MTRFNQLLRSAVFGSAFLLLSSATIPASPSQPAPTPTAKAQPTPKRQRAGPEVTAVELRPVKTRVGQSCPANLTFYGSITTNGATNVEYTWASSDGRSWPTRNLKFASAGTKSVSQNWKLGQPGKKVNKWLQLRIVSPNKMTSSEAPVTLNCAK